MHSGYAFFFYNQSVAFSTKRNEQTEFQSRFSDDKTKQIQPGLDQDQRDHKARYKISTNSEFEAEFVITNLKM